MKRSEIFHGDFLRCIHVDLQSKTAILDRVDEPCEVVAMCDRYGEDTEIPDEVVTIAVKVNPQCWATFVISDRLLLRN